MNLSAWFDLPDALTVSLADHDSIRRSLARMSKGIDSIRFDVDGVSGFLPHVLMAIDGEDSPATWNADGSDSSFAVLDAASASSRDEWIESIAFRAGCACFAQAWQCAAFRKLIAGSKVPRFPTREARP